MKKDFYEAVSNRRSVYGNRADLVFFGRELLKNSFWSLNSAKILSAFVGRENFHL